eukprot:CAMPEP_0119097540 /NCGR_PEP_ID=MMETSP1178-20130426/178911_1 /TAXON_ID=33656 /ORGANISM="unid sp, Strain CCMP2000" /LENGTH=54 /DNA_ID=CAMNT_0007081485 /DNA_START=10 /DNA_END=173 /DNA_ORIENTATION=-
MASAFFRVLAAPRPVLNTLNVVEFGSREGWGQRATAQGVSRQHNVACAHVTPRI